MFPLLRIAFAATLLLTMPMLQVQAQSPLNPAGWSDLYTQSRGVGFWINGQRLCGIAYDPGKLETMIGQVAAGLNVSVTRLKREGQLRADEAVPFFTRESCDNAKKQARRLDLLPGRAHRELAPRPETGNSLIN